MDLNINVYQLVNIADYSITIQRWDIYFVDYVNGASGNSGRSWGLAKKRLDDITVNNVYVYVAKSPDPVSIGNVTFTDNSTTITLATALTLLVSDCESAWSVVTNITQANDSTYKKEGTYGRAITVASAFTTGKMAYIQVGGGTPIDYSGYTKLTFWIRVSSQVTASYLKFCLCSDTTGDTIVDNFTIPLILYASTPYCMTVAKDGGGALGSSIQSIALYAITDPGSPIIYFDNINACNDFSLRSLVGKNTSNDKNWYSLKYIMGTTVCLGAGSDAGTYPGKCFYGTSETVEGFRRECIPTVDHLQSSSATNIQSTTNSFRVYGGFNPATGVQDGITFFDAINCFGIGFRNGNNSGSNGEEMNLGWVRCYTALSFSSYVYSHECRDLWAVGCGGSSFSFQISGCQIKNIHVACAAGQYGIVLSLVRFSTTRYNNMQNITVYSGSTGTYLSGIYISSVDAQDFLDTFDICGCQSSAIAGSQNEGGAQVWNNVTIRYGYIGFHCNGILTNFLIANMTGHALNGEDRIIKAYNGEFRANAATVYLGYRGSGDVEIENCLTTDTVDKYNTSSNSLAIDGKVKIQKYNRVAGEWRCYFKNGQMKNNNSVFRTSSPSVECARGNGVGHDPTLPQDFAFPVPITNGVARSISVWLKCTSNTLTGDASILLGVKINGAFKIPLRQIGISDLEWRQFTLDLLSEDVTDTGSAELILRMFNVNNGTCYVDDLTWS